jgi:hypothetical protein
MGAGTVYRYDFALCLEQWSSGLSRGGANLIQKYEVA